MFVSTHGTSVENQRLVTLLYVVAGIAGGVLVRSAALQVMAYQSVEDPVLGGVLSATAVAGLVGAALTFGLLSRNAKANEFADSALSEMKKVTWPTRDETVNNTGIVVGAAVGFGALMFVYDYSWSAITAFALYSTTGQ